MKKCIIIITALCLICLLTGTQFGYMFALDQYELPKLTAWQQWKIEKDWLSAFGYEAFPWHEEDHLAGTRYYGTYTGYVILYTQGWDSSGPYKEKVGNFVFQDSHGFALYAYKGGEFIRLDNAYEEGLIIDKEVEEIYKLHVRYEQEFG